MIPDDRSRAGTASFVQVAPHHPAALTALGRYFAHLDEVFPTGLADADVREGIEAFRAPTGAFVIATIDRATIGCGAVQTLEPGVGEIKRMWIADEWRGFGLGRRMVAELERIVARMGHTKVRLDTNAALDRAIALYESLGYRAIPAYNDNPYAHHWFEKRLV